MQPQCEYNVVHFLNSIRKNFFIFFLILNFTQWFFYNIIHDCQAFKSKKYANSQKTKNKKKKSNLLSVSTSLTISLISLAWTSHSSVSLSVTSFISLPLIFPSPSASICTNRWRTVCNAGWLIKENHIS